MKGRNDLKSFFEPRAVAAFVVAAYEGSIGLAKCSDSPDLLDHCIHGLKDYVESLRPQHTEREEQVA